MHRPIVYLIAWSVLAGSALAQARTGALPSPATKSSFRDIQEPIVVKEREKLRSRMRTSGFDYRKMENRNRRLMRAVCSDCTTNPERELRSIGAGAQEVELHIVDPGVAPDQ